MFGDELKKSRKALGLSQWDLAESLGIRQSQVSDFEKGKARPTHEQAIKISKLLNNPNIRRVYGYTSPFCQDKLHEDFKKDGRASFLELTDMIRIIKNRVDHLEHTFHMVENYPITDEHYQRAFDAGLEEIKSLKYMMIALDDVAEIFKYMK